MKSGDKKKTKTNKTNPAKPNKKRNAKNVKKKNCVIQIDSENSSEITLNDSYWMDSFDKLIANKTPLRKKQVIKRKIRASFNRDSSLEVASNSEDMLPVKKIKKIRTYTKGLKVVSTPVKVARGVNDIFYSFSPTPIDTINLRKALPIPIFNTNRKENFDDIQDSLNKSVELILNKNNKTIEKTKQGNGIQRLFREPKAFSTPIKVSMDVNNVFYPFSPITDIPKLQHKINNKFEFNSTVEEIPLDQQSSIWEKVVYSNCREDKESLCDNFSIKLKENKPRSILEHKMENFDDIQYTTISNIFELSSNVSDFKGFPEIELMNKEVTPSIADKKYVDIDISKTEINNFITYRKSTKRESKKELPLENNLDLRNSLNLTKNEVDLPNKNISNKKNDTSVKLIINSNSINHLQLELSQTPNKELFGESLLSSTEIEPELLFRESETDKYNDVIIDNQEKTQNELNLHQSLEKNELTTFNKSVLNINENEKEELLTYKDTIINVSNPMCNAILLNSLTGDCDPSQSELPADFVSRITNRKSIRLSKKKVTMVINIDDSSDIFPSISTRSKKDQNLNLKRSVMFSISDSESKDDLLNENAVPMKLLKDKMNNQKTILLKKSAMFTEEAEKCSRKTIINFPREFSHIEKRKTVIFQDNVGNEKEDLLKPTVKLQPGKWRKSLAIWRRTHNPSVINQSKICHISLDCTDNSSIIQENRPSINCGRHRKSIKLELLDESFEAESTDTENAIVLEPSDVESYNKPAFSLLNESVNEFYGKKSSGGNQQILNRSISVAGVSDIIQFDETRSQFKRQTQQIYRYRRTNSVRGSATFFPKELFIPEYVNSDLLATKDIVLRRCGQSDPLDFNEVYSESNLLNCRKVGEGVYSEVFMNKTSSGQAVVLKIIPIEGTKIINGEIQKKYHEILSEIIISMELSKLKNDPDFMTNGFVDVIKVRCVQGRYPEHLIDLWELYRDNSGTDNDHPEIFDDDQLFIVLELSNGGQDLEAFNFHNALQSYSAFLQTALTLAVAEQKFQFEHRDLHWGNILLSHTDEKEITYKFNSELITIPSHGVKVTIIDYTLSRMIFNGHCQYNDLSQDDELFAASGDYQFDIYRLMKLKVDNAWQRFEPYTNILWLHYTIDKMINGARYRYKQSKKHRAAIQDMMQLRDELLEYKSASDFIQFLL